MRKRSIHELLGDIGEAERLRGEAKRANAQANRANAKARFTLRNARLEAGLTQSDVADRMGVSKAYVSTIENGYSATPSTLTRFAQAITEGGPDGHKGKRRSAQDDLKQARGQSQDD